MCSFIYKTFTLSITVNEDTIAFICMLKKIGVIYLTTTDEYVHLFKQRLKNVKQLTNLGTD